MGNKKTPKLCSYTAQTLDYHLLLVCVFMGTDTWVQCFNTVCFSLHVAVDFWSSTKIETPEHFWQLQCVKARASGCGAKRVISPPFCIPHLIWYVVMPMWTLTGWITAVTSKLPCVSNVMLPFFYWPFCLLGRLFTDLCVRKTRFFSSLNNRW